MVVYETKNIEVLDWGHQGFIIQVKGELYNKRLGKRKSLSGAIKFADKKQLGFIDLRQAINQHFYNK